MHYHVVTRLYASKHNYVDGLLIQAPYKHLYKAAKLLCPGAFLLLCCSEPELYKNIEALTVAGLTVKDIILVIGASASHWILAQKHIATGKLLTTLLQHNIGALHITSQPHSNVIVLHTSKCYYDHMHQVWRCQDCCGRRLIKFIESSDEDGGTEAAYTECESISALLRHFIRLIAPDGTKIGILGFSATLIQQALSGTLCIQNDKQHKNFAEVLIEDI